MTRLRKALFALVALAVGLAVLEGSARLLPVEAISGPAENALRFAANPELQNGSERYWQRDPQLFWKMRADLDVDFGGLRLHTNSQGYRDAEHVPAAAGELLVAFLGDSTTFGWGVADPAERFSDRVPQLLNERLVGRRDTTPTGPRPPRVRGLNFGQTGYSTVQAGRLLVAELLPQRPDAIAILLAANDFGQATGRTDAAQPVADRASTVAATQTFLAHSTFYRRLAGALASWRDRRAGESAGRAAAAASALQRVPPGEFEHNLADMIVLIRAGGSRPVLMTYPRRPTNPLLPCPRVDPADADLLLARDRSIVALGALLQPVVTDSLMDVAAAPADPLTRWNTLAAELGGHPSYHYGRGYLLFRAGRVDAAEDALATAAASPLAGPADCAMDLFSTALFRHREEPAAGEYNRIIAAVATATGTPLVDVHALLVDAQQALVTSARDEGRTRTEILSLWFGPESYFVDVVHPSARGHALIAAALAETLAQMEWPAIGTQASGL